MINAKICSNVADQKLKYASIHVKKTYDLLTSAANVYDVPTAD